MAKAVIQGDRPSAFLSKASLAAELDMSESTVDEMVRRGVLPKPHRMSTGCIRWKWAAVERALDSLNGESHDAASDPYLMGAQRVTTEGRRGTA